MSESRFATFVGVFVEAIEEFKQVADQYSQITYTGPHRRFGEGERTLFYMEGPEQPFFMLLSDCGYSHEDFDTLTIVELNKT